MAVYASSNGKFIKAQWQFYQGAETAILSKVVQRPLYQGQAQWASLSKRIQLHFYQGRL